MSLVRRILVGDQERALLIRKGRFERILDPGQYWVFGTGITLETHNVREVQFASPWADYLAKGGAKSQSVTSPSLKPAMHR
jgi:regulator of protease activity HflC (stomatin/prohibitin superfamily)